MTTQSLFDEVDVLFDEIDRGRQGLNLGVSTGLPKLDAVLSGGIQRKTFYLLGGPTGSGKSTLALYSFIFRPLMDGKLGDEKYKIIYYSLEMSAVVLYAKLLSMFIADQHGIELTYSQILSREEVLSEVHYNLVLECKDWLKQVKKQLVIYDKTLSSASLFANLKQYAIDNGEFVDSADGNQTVYIPKIKDEYVIVILDHIGLMRCLPAQSKKESMDVSSDYLIYFRNKCNYTPVVVMQLNRQQGSMDRRTEGMQEPELQDFKGSGGPGEAAEIVIAIHYPAREKQKSWKGYNLEQLRDKFRAIFCLKNRFGTPDQAVATSFFGSVGFFKEIPKPEEIGNNYAPYLRLFPDLSLLERDVSDKGETTVKYVL